MRQAADPAREVPGRSMPRRLIVRRLGVVAYAEGVELQRALVAQRTACEIDDTLLLLQHPHVLTFGVKAGESRQHVLATPERLAELGIETHESGRGGDVTYHGPGQIVGYPILDLKPDRCDVHRYVRDLEDVMIRVAGEYGHQAGRIDGLTGAWVGAEKIGAIGVRIQRWVTSHGFAFNVNTDLDFFRLIVPCGISGRGVTSLQRLSGREIPVPEVEDHIVRHFRAVFGRDS
jgi:lipoyl(octanoyl) transferase